MVYTMVEMAKANILNTNKYLTYLLSKQPNVRGTAETLAPPKSHADQLRFLQTALYLSA